MSVPRSMAPRKTRSIVGILRAAIEKLRFLLSSSAMRWVLLSSLSSVTRGRPRRALSFSQRRPSLLDAEGGVTASPGSSPTSRSSSMSAVTTRSVSWTSSGSPEAVQTKTTSGRSASASPGGDDDVDRRADEFIANFYRQLQMERQMSLQLRYVRGNSWDRTPKIVCPCL